MTDGGRCEKCQFWNRDATKTVFGECRRNAPSPINGNLLYLLVTKLNGSAAEMLPSDPEAVWPVTQYDDVCGQFMRSCTVARKFNTPTSDNNAPTPGGTQTAAAMLNDMLADATKTAGCCPKGSGERLYNEGLADGYRASLRVLKAHCGVKL